MGKAALPPKALERALPLFCPASGGSRHPLACGCIILVSASVFTRPYRRLYQCLCVCVSVCVCVCVCMCSVVSDSVIPLTVVHQAPLSMGFSRQEYWSGLPFPPSGSPQPRDRTHISFISYISDGLFTTEPPGTLPFSLFLLFPCKRTLSNHLKFRMMSFKILNLTAFVETPFPNKVTFTDIEVEDLDESLRDTVQSILLT